VYPKYNNNISRKIYWKNRNNEWCDYIFCEFSKTKNIIFNIRFSEFIEYFFFDKKTYKNKKPFIFIDSDINKFCSNNKSKNPNPQSNIYKFWFSKMSNFIDVNNLKSSNNFNEMKFIIHNKLKTVPKCVYCNNSVHWNGNSYHSFCSQTCQIKYNNSSKELKLSNLDDRTIRNIILETPVDRRNTTNKKIADVFLNIHNYSKKFNMELSDREKIFIFVNEKQKADIICVCGNKKKFNSQIKGYFKTCTRKKCISVYKGCETIDESSINECASRNGTKTQKGYIYVCRAVNDVYKIGLTKHPESRLNTYKNIFDDFELIISSYVMSDLYVLEKNIHSKYSDKRTYIHDFGGKSETFRLDASNLKYIKRMIYEFND